MPRDISGPHRNREHRTPREVSPPGQGPRGISPRPGAHPGQAPAPGTPVPTTPAPGTHHPRPGDRGTGWATWHRDRKAELPEDWPERRRAVLERDGHRCTWLGEHGDRGPRCSARASVVDHIGSAHDHGLANLRALCTEHDRQRTAAQGSDAARRARTRPTETHPFIAEARRAGWAGPDPHRP